MKRVAIFGGKGQLAVELHSEFSARGYEVVSFDRASVDVSKQDAVDAAVAASKPVIVVNAAAYNLVDAAEKEPVAAFEGNALAVRNLAVACRNSNARLVHFSTDYVFDGMAGRAYTEDDPPHPLGAYGVSKLAGEFYARAYVERALIVRTSGVYGPAGAGTTRGNFVEVMLRLAAKGDPIRVLDDHSASPTYAPALAARAVDLVDREVHGIIHVGGGAGISWYDWAAMIFDAAGLKPALQRTNEREFKMAARRPKYSALSNRKMEELGLEPMPPLDRAIRMYFEAREERAAGS